MNPLDQSYEDLLFTPETSFELNSLKLSSAGHVEPDPSPNCFGPRRRNEETAWGAVPASSGSRRPLRGGGEILS